MTVLVTLVSVFVAFKEWLESVMRARSMDSALLAAVFAATLRTFTAPIRTDLVFFYASTVAAPIGKKEVEGLSLLETCFDTC